jgi:hypothetical protein
VIGGRPIPADHLQHALAVSITRLQFHLDGSAKDPAQPSPRRQKYEASMNEQKRPETSS